MKLRVNVLSFFMFFLLNLVLIYGNDKIVILPGTFQSVLGGNNWDPSGTSTKMISKDGVTYELTTVLPAGNYEYKVAVNETWDENYGQNGEQDGSNMKLTVKDAYAEIYFTFNDKSKIITQKINGSVSSDKFVTAAPKNELVITENVLVKTKDYIEKSPTETLFLFKTPVGAKIDFYIGEKGKSLKQVIKQSDSDGKGLVINNLTLGRVYNYKIVSTFLNQKLESPLETYTKETLVITKDRPEWAREAVFAEVFVRSFYDTNGDKVGDFAGLKEKLSYYKDLGITGLWLMPINSSPSYHGYDVTDYKNLNKEFGTINDFKELLDEAEKQGIKIIMDFVLNHTSSLHPWFKEAVKDKNSKYRDYFVWADPMDNTKKMGEWGQQVWHNKGTDKFYGVFYNGMPDLNYRNVNVRKEIKEATKFWLDLGIDGFRLDASKFLDTNNEVTQLWWNDFNTYVKSINKDAFIVGENWDTSMDFLGQFMASMDSSFNFNFKDLILSMAKGNNVNLMEEIDLRNEIYESYNKNFIDTLFIGNHDMTRVATELKNDIQKQKFAISILMTLLGTPFLYYGEELGQSGNRPDENLREPMDWYKDAVGLGMTDSPLKNGKLVYTKANDGISVEEQEKDSNSLLNFTKKIIKIRNENPIIISGTYKKLNSETKVNAYEITKGNESLIIIHNSNSNSINFPTKSGKIKVDAFGSAIIKNGENLLQQ